MATFFIQQGTTDITASIAAVANGDNIYFADGSQTVTAGIGSGGAAAAITTGLNSVLVDKSCSVSVGSAGSPWYFALASGSQQVLSYFAQAGNFYHASYTNGANATSARVRVISNGRYYLTAGTVTNLEIGNGTADVAGNVVTNLYMSGGLFYSLYSATAITLARISGGEANVLRSITTAEVSGGRLNVFQQNTSASPPSVTTLSVQGGQCIYKGGNITTLYLEGDGMIDMSMVPASMTVSTLITTRQAMARSRMQTNVPGATITYSSIRVVGAGDDAVKGL